MRRAARRALATLVALALTACSGYAELPLPLREAGTLEVEAATLVAGAPGRVQVAIGVPDDAVGPVVMVGNPAVDATLGGEVVAWAWGPCPDGPAPGASDDRPRLCVALTVTTTAPAAAFFLTAVVETRGDGRRFTVGGKVALP